MARKASMGSTEKPDVSESAVAQQETVVDKAAENFQAPVSVEVAEASAKSLMLTPSLPASGQQRSANAREGNDLRAAGYANKKACNKTIDDRTQQCIKHEPKDGSSSKPDTAFRAGSKSRRPESTRPVRPKGGQTFVAAPSATRAARQEELPTGTGGLYGRSPNSCNRHLRRRSNQGPVLADGTFEMAAARGLAEAEKAERAVKKAKAQVCLANLAVSVTCLALTVQALQWQAKPGTSYE